MSTSFGLNDHDVCIAFCPTVVRCESHRSPPDQGVNPGETAASTTFTTRGTQEHKHVGKSTPICAIWKRFAITGCLHMKPTSDWFTAQQKQIHFPVWVRIPRNVTAAQTSSRPSDARIATKNTTDWSLLTQRLDFVLWSQLEEGRTGGT